MGARKGKSKIDVNSNAQAYPPWFIPAVSYKAKKHHTEEAYHFGAVARPTDELKIYAKYDKVFRYPFTDEQANYYGWGSDAFNSDLVPEKGNSYELGIDLALTTNFSLQTTAFRTDMKDEIAFVGWPVNANVNLDETTHRGAEISLLYERDVFILEIYYTWLQSEFSEGTNKGNEIPWVPQNKMNASLAILLSDSLTASTHVGYTGSMLPLGDNDNNTAEKQSGYIITDLLLEYSMNTKKSDVILHAGIDNLFGKEYNFLVTDYGFGTGYYPAPKQIYKAGVTINF